jgi:hypothetical protein
MMRDELERVREWAFEQLVEGTESPGSWYHYTQPVELGAVDLRPH